MVMYIVGVSLSVLGSFGNECWPREEQKWSDREPFVHHTQICWRNAVRPTISVRWPLASRTTNLSSSLIIRFGLQPPTLLCLFNLYLSRQKDYHPRKAVEVDQRLGQPPELWKKECNKLTCSHKATLPTIGPPYPC